VLNSGLMDIVLYSEMVRQIVLTVSRNSREAGWNYTGFHVALTWISTWRGRYHYYFINLSKPRLLSLPFRYFLLLKEKSYFHCYMFTTIIGSLHFPYMKRTSVHFRIFSIDSLPMHPNQLAPTPGI